MNGTAGIQRRTVGIGCVCAVAGRGELVAYALGSCIALCLYDPGTKVGAMAHILLPSRRFSGHEDDFTDADPKYADHGLNEALRQMAQLGAERRRIRAAIVGGAAMFPHGVQRGLQVGEMNAASVTEELARRGIPLDYAAVGGEKSRTVTFRIPGNSFSELLEIRGGAIRGR